MYLVFNTIMVILIIYVHGIPLTNFEEKFKFNKKLREFLHIFYEYVHTYMYMYVFMYL